MKPEHVSKSNCILFALELWRRRGRSRRAGKHDKDRYLIVRESRIKGGILHMAFGKLDEKTGWIIPISYSPKVRQELPWYKLPLRFDGKVIRHDRRPRQDEPTIPAPPSWFIRVFGKKH